MESKEEPFKTKENNYSAKPNGTLYYTENILLNNKFLSMLCQETKRMMYKTKYD